MDTFVLILIINVSKERVRFMFRKFFVAILLALSTTYGFAQQRVYEGCYLPISGSVMTKTTSDTTQQGVFSMTLKRKNWKNLIRSEKSRIHRKLRLKGVLTGKFTSQTSNGPLVRHVLTPNTRKGMIITQDDYLIPETFDCFDSSGKPQIITGKEIINPLMGTEIYAGLISEKSQLVVHGTVNTCPNDQDYLKNDFTVLPEGQLCFSPTD